MLTKKLQVVGAVPAHRLVVSSSSLKKNRYYTSPIKSLSVGFLIIQSMLVD